MTTLELVFWISAAVVFYTYAGYPLILAGWARIGNKPRPRREKFTGSVSFVLAVHNEEANLSRRLTELKTLLSKSGIPGEIIVVSDGSTDATAPVARSFGEPVRVVELEQNQGKAAALSAGWAVSGNDILVFADARQRWDDQALSLLLENFADPEVGAVSGDLIVETPAGVLAGVGLYWRFEKWLRQQESKLHSTVGVTGAIAAVRRSLFRPIPSGTILDDVYWPLLVARQGYRVIHDQRAHAFDRLPEQTRDEFARKVRTLSGNFQLLGRLPGLLLPWRNPLWFPFVSHKLLRLLVPWALGIMLLSSPLIPQSLYHGLFFCQLAGYVLGLLGLSQPSNTNARLANAAGSFLVLNAAAWMAFWTWITGRAGRSWKKVSYHTS